MWRIFLFIDNLDYGMEGFDFFKRQLCIIFADDKIK